MDAFLDVQRSQQLTTQLKDEVLQESADNSLQFAADNALFANVTRSFVPLERRVVRQDKEKETPKEEGTKRIEQVRHLQETADKFHEDNPELKQETLCSLKEHILSDDSEETILKKVLKVYPDPSLADEVLSFLIETADDDELKKKLMHVKDNFFTTHKQAILAGKNTAQQVRAYAERGLGSPTALRDLYRGFITQEPKDATALFTQLTTTYTFDQMKTIIAFVFHSLGSDLKAEGPSIEKPKLAALLKDVKDMQAILGIYRFFKERMKLIFSSFEQEGLPPPVNVTYEALSKLFVQLLIDRFPSSEKVYQIAMHLGFNNNDAAEIIIFTQIRDAMRLVSPRLFRGDQHRQELFELLLTVLEELDKKEDAET